MELYKPHGYFKEASNGDWTVSVVTFVPEGVTLSKVSDAGEVSGTERIFTLEASVDLSQNDDHNEVHVFSVPAASATQSKAKVKVKDDRGNTKGSVCSLSMDFDM